MLLNVLLVIILALLIAGQVYAMKENSTINQELKETKLDLRTKEFIENRSKR